MTTENLTTPGLVHKVDTVLGPAAETIVTLFLSPTPFDLVFIDAENYAERLVRKGGAIVCRGH